VGLVAPIRSDVPTRPAASNLSYSEMARLPSLLTSRDYAPRVSPPRRSMVRYASPLILTLIYPNVWNADSTSFVLTEF
jgi:hypothetical protein